MRLFILLFYLLITILMIAIILFQKSESGLGLGGGSMGGMVTTRGVANLMTRATGVLATIFMVLSLALAYLSRREVEKSKLITRSAVALDASAAKPDEPTIPAETAAATPAVSEAAQGTAKKDDAPTQPKAPATGPTAPAVPAMS